MDPGYLRAPNSHLHLNYSPWSMPTLVGQKYPGFAIGFRESPDPVRPGSGSYFNGVESVSFFLDMHRAEVGLLVGMALLVFAQHYFGQKD